MSIDVEADSTFTSQLTSTSVPRNYVKFYPKWVRNNFRSEQTGTEVGENRDFVMIISPGQPKSEVHRPVQDKDKQEYRAEWQAYQEGREQRINGTPVELLPGLPQERADSLKAIYIHTIEQLASLSEPAMQKVGMGAVDLMNKAKGFLQKNSAEVMALKADLAQRDETIKTQGDQIAQLLERMAALEAGGKAKPRKAKPTPQPAVN